MTVENGREPESPAAENSAAPVETVAPAPSTTDAKTEGTPSSPKDELLDRVRAALKPKTEGSSPSDEAKAETPNPEASSEDDGKEPDADPTEEEQARYHSKTRKQVKRLLKQRNEALDQVKELTPHADVGRRITDFVRDAGMSADEANLLLEVGRNLKRDPAKALEQLRPYYQALQQMFGEVLPDDLQGEVTAGRITADYAKQLVASRTNNAVLTHRQQQNDAVADQQRQTATRQAHGDAVGKAISDWEGIQSTSDPDWKLKQARIGELIELDIRRNGYPKTTQEAVTLANAKKDLVNKEFAAYAPRKTNVTPIDTASASRTNPAPPKTALEAAKQGLAKMRA